MPKEFPSRARRLLMHDFAARLRAAPTDAERKLWFLLRRKRMSGLRFRRQQPIGPYVVDFFCPTAKLVVELDGDQHGLPDRRRHDGKRTRWFVERGFFVLRYGNWEVLRNPETVLDGIEALVRERAEKLPSLKGGVRKCGRRPRLM